MTMTETTVERQVRPRYRGTKTVGVQYLYETLQNAITSVSILPHNDENVGKLSALCFTLETVLMAAGQYRGFQFTDGTGERCSDDTTDAGGVNYFRRYYYPPRND